MTRPGSLLFGLSEKLVVGGPVVKNLPANAGDMGSILGLESSYMPRVMKPVHRE